MVHIEDVLLWSLAQDGDLYVFGAEASPLDPDPEAFDCSELIEWSCARAGAYIPDGAYNQWLYASRKGAAISVADGIATRGALLCRGPGRGTGRAYIDHIAFSLGDGTTIEARGRAWGVGSFSAHNRGWGWAVRIPDVDYSPRNPLPAPPVVLPPNEESDKMTFCIVADSGDQTWWITDQVTKRRCTDGNELAFLATYCGLRTNNGAPLVWPRTWVDGIPLAA